jgi:hypothetical protein
MNSYCLLDLVRSSAPEHYGIHPIWKNYVGQNSTSSCENATHASLDDFFVKMFQQGKLEMLIMNTIIMCTAVTGIFYIFKRLLEKSFCSLRSLIGYVFMAYLHASFFHTITHYQNDITHLNGNVMHHSEYRVEGFNETFVGTLPPGLLFVFTINFFVVLGIVCGFARSFGMDHKLYASIASLVIPAKLLFNMKVIHPYIHKYHKSWYPWPLTFIFKDYRGHVLCHHVTGYCLGLNIYLFIYNC